MGAVNAISVGSTAFGTCCSPALRDLTGSYTPAFLVAAPLPLLIGVAALLVRPPSPCGER